MKKRILSRYANGIQAAIDFEAEPAVGHRSVEEIAKWLYCEDCGNDRERQLHAYAELEILTGRGEFELRAIIRNKRKGQK